MTLSSSSSSPLPLSFSSSLLVDSLESPARSLFVSSEDFVSGELLPSSVVSSVEPLSVVVYFFSRSLLAWIKDMVTYLCCVSPVVVLVVVLVIVVHVIVIVIVERGAAGNPRDPCRRCRPVAAATSTSIPRCS